MHEFLKNDRYITSDDLEIRALATQIFSTLSVEDQNNSYMIAWKVYEWIVKNINHDGLFTNDTTDGTSGIWKTIS